MLNHVKVLHFPIFSHIFPYFPSINRCFGAPFPPPGIPASTVSFKPPVGATMGSVPRRMASICTRPQGSHLSRFFLSFLGDANGGDFWWYNDINRHIYIYIYTLYIDIFISVNMWDNIWLYIHMSIYIYIWFSVWHVYTYIYNLYMFLYAIYLRFISISKYYIYTYIRICIYIYIYIIYIFI